MVAKKWKMLEFLKNVKIQCKVYLWILLPLLIFSCFFSLRSVLRKIEVKRGRLSVLLHRWKNAQAEAHTLSHFLQLLRNLTGKKTKQYKS